MIRASVFFVILLFLFGGTPHLYATHCAGGELVYAKLPGTPNTYRFTFKFYRACGTGNAAPPASVKMCYSNQCGVSDQSVILDSIRGILPNGKRNGTPVSTGCPGFPTNCSGGNIPGYQEWWYTRDLVLPSICDNWKFWVSVDARNNAITNLTTPGSQTIYIEAMFNNAVSEDNSSPYFSNVPVPYCCAGQLFSYNNGAIDADGDSLVFESIRPRTGSSNNQSCTAAPGTIPYSAAAPALNAITNPFNTSNTYNLNTLTGAISFTPAGIQTAVVTVKVYEYRDKVLIGYVMRDLQVIVTSCNAPVPALSIDPTSVMGGVLSSTGFRVNSCAGNELRFCFDLKSPDPTSILVPSDNHTLSIPGGTVSYSNSLTDSVRGCVVWATTPADAGLHVLTVTIRDSACRPPGLIVSHTFSIPIQVNPVTVSTATVNRTICDGQSYLGHTTAGLYTDTLVNATGCDSIHIMDLAVNPVFAHSVTDTICSDMLPYIFGLQRLSSGGIFTEAFSAVTGCDSSVRLTLVVLPVTSSVVYAVICPGDTFAGYTAAGVYRDTFVNADGCDSIRLINLVINPVTFSLINQAICPGQSYQGYDTTGIYLDTFVNAGGCDSIRMINLAVTPVTYGSVSQEICEGSAYLGYTISGIYTDTLVSVSGCDSIRTLQLSVHPILYQTVDTAICAGRSYAGYAVTGTYTDTLISSLRCDSIRTLNLIVKPIRDTAIRMEICSGESFLGYTASGTYRDTFMSSIGCDSIRTVNLTVYPLTFSAIIGSICPGQAFLGYMATGIYRDTFVNANGCDSIRMINLTVNPVTFSTLTRTICPGDSYLGYDSTATYMDTLVSVKGCDSIRTLHLLVTPILYETVDTTICEGQSYGGYTLTGTYTDTLMSSLRCDSIRTLNLIVKPLRDTAIYMELCDGGSFLGYASTGQYTDVFLSSVGCDSFRHLDLIVHPVYFHDTTVNVCEGTGFYAGGAFRPDPGVYWDSLRTVAGCDSVTKTTVTMSPVLYPELGEDRWICKGDSVTLFAGAFDHYQWNTGTSAAMINVYQEGMYTVTVYNIPGCDAADSVNVYTRDLPDVRIQYQETDICLGDTIHLSTEEGLSYQWFSEVWIAAGSSYSFATPADRQRLDFMVKGTDVHGCTGSDSVSLHVISCCGSVFLPNAFTPNGDGRNDRFGVITVAFFEQFHLMILDRWGRMVYETDNPRKGWDGTRHGIPAETGSYFYLIKARCYRQHDPVVLKGDITLMR